MKGIVSPPFCLATCCFTLPREASGDSRVESLKDIDEIHLLCMHGLEERGSWLIVTGSSG